MHYSPALSLARAALLRQWLAGGRPDLEQLLGEHQLPLEQDQAVVELIHLEAILRQARGEHPSPEEYAKRFPALNAAIQERFALDPGLEARPSPAPDTFDPDATVAPQPTTLSGNEPRDWPEVSGYEILSELGRGGMGVVYKARQTGLGRLVALKMLLAGAHAGQTDLLRFRQEAEALARLTHPNIVQVHEVGEADVGSGTPCPYFSLEFCEGGSLADRLGKPLDAEEAARLIRTLAEAVEVAHAKGIIHRDLKPGNILLTEVGALKIADFGLARLQADVDSQRGEATQTGAVMGTPGYLSPEQAAGQTKQISPATDIWALGAILYECLTGTPPFRAATMFDTLMLVLDHDPLPPRQVNPNTPRDLETITLKCLRKRPEDRYRTAAELADELERFLEDEPILARPPSLASRIDRWVRKRQGTVIAWGAALLLLVSVAWLADVTILVLPGMKTQTTRQILFTPLPVILWVAAGMAWCRGRVSMLAAVTLGPAVWYVTGWGDWGPTDRFSFQLFRVGLGALATVLVGLLAGRGWPWAVIWLVLGGALAPWVGFDRWAVLMGYGLVVGGFVWLVRWALSRDSAAVVLGGITGAALGLGVAESYGLQMRMAFGQEGFQGLSHEQIGCYLMACVTFLGTVVGGLVGPMAHDYRGAGGAQVVPSLNRTSSSR